MKRAIVLAVGPITLGFIVANVALWAFGLSFWPAMGIMWGVAIVVEEVDLRYGFEETGEVDDGEVVIRLSL